MRFIRAGLQTSVQDLGRSGLMRYGISRGGAADAMAMQLANLLLGRPPGNPVLEVTLTGPKIEFRRDLAIAVVGAQFELTQNGEPVDNNRVLHIRRGDTLIFGRLLSGARAYIAFSGLLDLPPVFGCCGTNLVGGFGGLHGRAIQDGDIIDFREVTGAAPRQLDAEYQPRYTGHPQLRVVAGAEERHFDTAALADFYRQAFQVSAQSNRMGIRLQGRPLNTEELPQIVSSGLCPGTIQIPPGGLPIISFVEGQTIGGYPRIAHVISADLHILGQVKAGDRVSLRKVSPAQAQQILAGKTALLDKARQRLNA